MWWRVHEAIVYTADLLLAKHSNYILARLLLNKSHFVIKIGDGFLSVWNCQLAVIYCFAAGSVVNGFVSIIY